MGSLSASGIPVVTKQNRTFRKGYNDRLYRVDSVDDTETDIVDVAPDTVRAIGSGSIVRDDNVNPATVDYYENRVWGLYMGGRSSSARIPSDT